MLADGKVRHVGEPIAVCVADSRAAAEDLAAAVEVDFDELPAVVDMRAALNSESRVHEHWDNNVFLETFIEVAPERFATSAPIVVRRRLRTARQCMSPMEGRGVVATWDRRLEQLLIYTSTQMPHIVRTGLAGCLGLPEARIRVVAPDVGGGFGYKGDPAGRGSLRGMAVPQTRSSRALDRGSPRATHRQRELPRASTTTSPCTPRSMAG